MSGTEERRQEKVEYERLLQKLARGEQVDLSHLSRSDRLIVINEFLQAQDLRPLDGLGDASQGEMEFVGVNCFVSDPFVARLDFETVIGVPEKRKQFNHLVFTTSHSAKGSASIIVPFLRLQGDAEPGHILVVKQFRPVLGRFTTELPRGFADAGDFSHSDTQSGILRELEEETGIVSAFRDTIEVEKMQPVLESSGTHNVINAVYKVTISLSQLQFDAVKQKMMCQASGHKIRSGVIPLREASTALDDNHSLAALARCMSNEFR
jgi:hypothetical protein